MGNQCRLRSASDICSYFLIPVISRAKNFFLLFQIDRIAIFHLKKNSMKKD